MVYRIKQLAKLSGLSTRTLRYYDEIGLLKPAFIGENKYRYYGKEQLLLLQHILFYRELGFELGEIVQVINAGSFDKVAALKQQKSLMQASIARTQTLIQTLDKTLLYLEGDAGIRLEELFAGFDMEKQQEHERYMIASGLMTQQDIDDSWARVAHWKKSDWEIFKSNTDALYKRMAEALEDGCAAESKQFQALMQQHFNIINQFWTPTQEGYLKLKQMYLEHPDYQAFFTRYHPKLATFLAQAMVVFSQKQFSPGGVS